MNLQVQAKAHSADAAQARQLSLFAPMMEIYRGGEDVSNETLYASLRQLDAIPRDDERRAVGRAAVVYSTTKRRVRWWQQTLKSLQLIERVPGERGKWRATPKAKGRDGLTPAVAPVRLLGYSTKLGIALWGDGFDVLRRLGEPIHLYLSSPPYCISRARAYGGPAESEYVDFICRMLEPVVASLAPGGSIALNVSNDVFVPGTPARSLYRERLVLALHDRLGLHKMDELIWANNSKAPGPIAWASKQRMQLNTGWEPVYWFALNPNLVRADNRRALQPHSERHLRLMQRGGEQRTASYGDGANRIQPGAFGAPTSGRIPKNVLQFGHRCHSQKEARAEAAAQGLPVHGATMPLSLARFLVEFLTQKDDLIVDSFAGWNTTGLAAEQSGRRWISVERMLEYVLGSAPRFRSCIGFEPGFAS